MEMESTRRSFDRSREPGLKKPRLADDQPNRPFVQRPFDSSRGGAYQPLLPAQQQQQQQQQYQELVSQYKTALAELTFNSKPIITNLTIIAGENLHAAKALAATVCANILEVPSEQKLPSLYLLDSIVKNIGRDYIRYFASRLPEVFIKAYRQVDPPVHSSMRHLFGTWKGVFPPHSLQIIEKELGFTSAANGSSLGSTTSRPDSQSQRPPHSIHINPKYLERQRLQQSGRAKVMVNDTTPPEDADRPDRPASVNASRTLVDPSVKVPNIQHSNREVINDPALGKKTSAVYGDIEYNSDVLRNVALGIGRTSGRVAEKGPDKPWYGSGSNFAEALPGQKNGFNLKHGDSSYPVTKSNNIDLHPQPTKNIASRSGNGMSNSWKNSEEEEFMWEMHSRLSEQDTAHLPYATTTRKDRWTPDDAEKMDFDNHLRKPQSILEVGSRFDTETSSDSLSAEQKEQSTFGHRLSSPWRSQESQSSDGQVLSGITGNAIRSEGHSATFGGLPTSASGSVPRVTVQSHMGSSHVGTSSYGFSANASSRALGSLGQQRFGAGSTSPHQKPPSPLVSAHFPHQQLQNSAEKDQPPTQSLSGLDYKASQYSGKLPSSKAQLGKMQKLQGEELRVSSSSMPSRQYLFSKLQQPERESDLQISKLQPPIVSNLNTPTTSGRPTSGKSNPLAAETSGQPSMTSLLADVVKSGILSNITSASLSSRISSGSEKIPPQFTFSGSRAASAASSDPRLLDKKSATLNVIDRKEERPPLPPGPPPTAQTSTAVDEAPNPISNLLSSLVAKGLISASKSNTSSVPSEKPSESQNQNPSITSPLSGSSESPHSSTAGEASIPETDANSAALSESSAVEIENLIGLKFKPDVIREFHSPVISSLYDDLAHQCSICGLRLKVKERLDRHLEWHSWKKQDSDGLNKLTRRWYADSDHWVTGKAQLPFAVEGSSLLDGSEMRTEEDVLMVPADENQCVCLLCGDLFEDYFSQEKSKWMFKGAVYMTPGSVEIGTADGNSKRPIVHAHCISDNSFHDLGPTSPIKTEKDT